jgi:AcrR family transcriptional regulator
MAPEETAAPSWREVAVARSLDPVRARAEGRVQRFLDAALELMNTSPDFTVQEVVEKSGQSLRSFYQYFAGKYELLLGLFEESVRATAEQLRSAVDDVDDPLERLHTFAVEYYRVCRPAPPKARSNKKSPSPATMAAFAQQLLTEHPKEASRAFVPLVALFEELLEAAEASGQIRKGLAHHRIAGVVLESIMFNIFATTISGASPKAESGDDGAEGLWELLLYGIGTERPR